MATTSDDSSKKHFHWTNKVRNEEEDDQQEAAAAAATPLKTTTTTTTITTTTTTTKSSSSQVAVHRKRLQAKLRSVLAAFNKHRSPLPFGPRVTGTLFGHRRGHVHFALQKEPNSPPAFLIELATSTSGLVQEMASGLVRIALECDKLREEDHNYNKVVSKLVEEPLWRTYCNGKKSGFATKRECGEKEWKVLRAVEMISMGAGVLPASDGEEDEVMYMRAKFERVVGSSDSEAYYMMNPDCNGAPELSIYLLRV